MTFEDAVGQAEGLEEAWREGLGALRRADKERINAADTRRLAGSVDVDTAFEKKFPEAPRWDYGIGYRPANLKEDVAYWVEIHPASAGDIKQVLAKLAWLKSWLSEHAVELNALRREFIWVSSGKTSFTLTAPQQKRFALFGLRHTGRMLPIPAEFVA